MNEKSLNIDTGVVTFHINGVYDLTFNPSDSEFVQRIYDAFSELDKRQDAYKDKISKMGDGCEIFDFARERNREMRELIDSTLGGPVCDAVFGSMSVYALSGGLPVWANLMLAIMDEIDSNFTCEQKLTNPRIKKYTDKYSKYTSKYHE